jgi:hypothetical protein
MAAASVSSRTRSQPCGALAAGLTDRKVGFKSKRKPTVKVETKEEEDEKENAKRIKREDANHKQKLQRLIASEKRKAIAAQKAAALEKRKLQRAEAGAEAAKKKRAQEDADYRDGVIDDRVAKGAVMLETAIKALLPAPLTMEDIKAFDAQYRANPARLWRNESAMLKCAYDDTMRTDRVWTTTKKLATMISNRSQEAFQSGLDAIKNGAIDLKDVDCFLPVFRHQKDRYCMDCRHGSSERIARLPNGCSVPSSACRKMSIMRLWVGAIGAGFSHRQMVEVNAWKEEEGEEPRDETVVKTLSHLATFSSFLHTVLFPTGFATRYNEVFNCRGMSALEMAIGLSYRYGGGHGFCFTPALMLLQAMPLEAIMPCRHKVHASDYGVNSPDWYEERYGRGGSDAHRIYACTDVTYVKDKLKAHQDAFKAWADDDNKFVLGVFSDAPAREAALQVVAGFADTTVIPWSIHDLIAAQDAPVAAPAPISPSDAVPASAAASAAS